MAKTEDLQKLFRAIGTRDNERARQLASEIAEKEDSAGRHSIARALRGALTTSAQSRELTFSDTMSRVHANSFVVQEELGPTLDNVTLPTHLRSELRLITDEWRVKEKLEANGLARKSRLLFHGPPGCGKTLTARALGRELGLPVTSVRVSSIVGSYLGETGNNLRQVFRQAEASPSILLLDEVDAFARSRGRATDVGELDRVVVSLLQEFDHSRPAGLLIAATNIPRSLDAALWRRFDAALEFPRPTATALHAFGMTLARKLNLRSNGNLKARLIKAGSFAEVEKIVSEAKRKEIIESLRTRR